MRQARNPLPAPAPPTCLSAQLILNFAACPSSLTAPGSHAPPPSAPSTPATLLDQELACPGPAARSSARDDADALRAARIFAGRYNRSGYRSRFPAASWADLDPDPDAGEWDP